MTKLKNCQTLLILLVLVLVAGCSGKDGNDGQSQVITGAFYCWDLNADYDFGWNYYLWEFENGDIFVSGAIYNLDRQASASRFYKKGTEGHLSGFLPLRFDIVETANNGQWILSGARESLTFYLTYSDSDLEESPLEFEFLTPHCEVYPYD